MGLFSKKYKEIEDVPTVVEAPVQETAPAVTQNVQELQPQIKEPKSISPQTPHQLPEVQSGTQEDEVRVNRNLIIHLLKQNEEVREWLVSFKQHLDSRLGI